MEDINKFLEKECGFKDENNIIEEEILNTEVEDSKIKEMCDLLDKNEKDNLENNYNIWKKENSDFSTEKNFINYFENDYSIVKKIMEDILFKDNFYLYTQNSPSTDNIDILNIQIQNIDKILENKISFYEKKNDDLLKKNVEVKNKLNEKKKKNLQENLDNIKEQLKEKNKKKDNSSLFDTIKLNDEIDKIERDIRILEKSIQDLPEEINKLNIEIQYIVNEIKTNTKYIKIFQSFPVEEYKDYLNMKINIIDNNKKKNKLSNFFKISIYAFVIYLITNLFTENILFITIPFGIYLFFY